MKRKFEEGVVNLTEVIKKQDPTDSFRPMAFNYRAYGYFCCDKIKVFFLFYLNILINWHRKPLKTTENFKRYQS